MTHKEKVLALLSDGRAHGHMEGYRLGVMLHSRVADLRKEGHNIDCWRDGDNYMYRLVSLDGATSDPLAPASSLGETAALVAPSSEPSNRREADADAQEPLTTPAWDGGPLAVHVDQLRLIEAA